ncbi:MAG: hypothetical protein ACO36I_14115 [Candidatus Latescibacterota bacterium]
MHTIIYLLFLLISTTPTFAQPNPEALKTEMQKLDFLVGKWEGTGWIQYGPNRSVFSGTETVQRKLDGLILMVEGLHKTQIPNRPEPIVVHHALGIFSYNPAGQHFRFRTYLHKGQEGDYTAHWENDALIWEMDIPNMGQMRYTIRLNKAGQWYEIGERSTDGKTWTQFFEMTLNRIGDA